MFRIQDVIKLLTRIFAKQNKRFPKGLEAVDIRLKAKKIHDIGKANNYEGGISENQLKHFLAWEKQAPITTEVSKDILKVPKKKGEVIKVDFDPGGKQTFITQAEKKSELDKLLGPDDDVFGSPIKDWHMKKFKEPKAKDVTPTEAEIKVKLEGMNKQTVDRIRRRRYEAALKAEREKMAKDPDYLPKVLDPDDFAYGGIAGMLGETDRVPYGGGGAGKPPITFTLQGGGSYAENEIGPGLNLAESGYGFDLGAEIGLPWGFSATGGLGIGRGKTEVDYNDQNVFTGVDETKLGDKWNVGIEGKWPVDFNKLLMGKADGGIAGMLGEPTYADGGRIGLKDGFDPKRRGFLKLAAGLASIPLIGKYFKWAKPLAKSSKVLTQVPIENAAGMPVWFKPLVNRVIKEGEDITKLPPNKGGAFAEREIVHSAKLGEGQGVRVTQNLDNQTISVEYHSVDNMGGIDDAVRLEYKAAEEIATKKGSVKTKPTFEAEEAWPHGTTDDYKDITMEGSNVVTKVDDLYSDTSALKQFGTNKTLSKKELEIAKQKRKRVNEINSDLSEQSQLLPEPPLPDDYPFASGGRVPLSGGLLAKGIGKFTKSEVLIKMLEKTLKGSKDSWSKTNLPNFIKELKANPELANDPEVWKFFTGKLPKNQRLVVHSDDTVDFWTQSKFGSHNIKTTDKFMQKHPHLSRDEAVRIQNMEPEDQILEMKRLETIADRSRTKNASGGRVPMWLGGGLPKGKDLLRAIMKHHAETGTTGLTGSKMLGLVNPKQFNKMLNRPEGIPSIAKEMIEKYMKEMKVDRLGAVEHSLGLAKKMKKSKDKLKEMDKITEKLTKEFVDKGMDKKMVKDLVDMFINAKYPDALKIKALPNITDEAILELENIGKNLATKDRKLNASGGRVSLSSGGLAGMLGE